MGEKGEERGGGRKGGRSEGGVKGMGWNIIIYINIYIYRGVGRLKFRCAWCGCYG